MATRQSYKNVFYKLDHALLNKTENSDSHTIFMKQKVSVFTCWWTWIKASLGLLEKGNERVQCGKQ